MRKLALIMSALLLSGCAGSSLLPVEGSDAVEVVKVAGDRFNYWYLGVKEQAEVKKQEAIARQEEAKAQQATFNGLGDKGWDLSKVESQAMFVMHQSNQMMALAMREQSQIILALTGKDMNAYTPMPKGAFSEGMDSFFGGIANVGNSTGGKLLAGGIAGKWVLDALGGWQGHHFSTEGGNLSISDSLNRSNISMTNSEDGLVRFYSPETTTSTEVIAPETF